MDMPIYFHPACFVFQDIKVFSKWILLKISSNEIFQFITAMVRPISTTGVPTHNWSPTRYAPKQANADSLE